MNQFFDALFTRLKKSQLGLFNEPVAARAKPRGKRISFHPLKPAVAQAPKIGDTKNESGVDYVFLETTIGKPRWHRRDEPAVAQMQAHLQQHGITHTPEKVLSEYADVKAGRKEKPSIEAPLHVWKMAAAHVKHEGEENPTIPEAFDIHKIVQKRLDEKQKSKDFKDAGNRVSGSKKEIAQYRKITASELAGMDDVTAFAAVKKDKVFTPPDIAAMREAGEASGLVYLKKKLYDAIPVKPENTSEARKAYVELLPKIWQKIHDAKDMKELEDFYSNNISRDYFRDKNWKYRTQYFLIGDESKVPLNGAISKEFINLLNRWDSDSAKAHWKKARHELTPFSQEASDKKYEDYAKSAMETNKFARERYEKKTRKDLVEELELNSKYHARMTIPQVRAWEKNNPKLYEDLIERVRKYELMRVMGTIPKSQEDFLRENPHYKAREEDWSWAGEEEKKKDAQSVSTDMKIHDNPFLTHIKRTNGRAITQADITPEAIREKFGFQSVQFGSYVKDKEAQRLVQHFLESISDLEDVLEIDFKKVTKLSNLSIAFGARGGGKFAAHYEPVAKIINMTKTQGDGSVAHEVFHFFDHMLSKMAQGKKGGRYLSDAASSSAREMYNLREELSIDQSIISAMNDVMSAIKEGTQYNDVATEYGPSTGTTYFSNAKSIYENEGLETAINYATRWRNRESIYRYLARLEGKPIKVTSKQRKTKYMAGAMSFKSDYWTRGRELFARAAEGYIQDKLSERQMYNNYLVAGNNVEIDDAKWSKEGLIRAYPQGEERKDINKAFDHLWEVARRVLEIGQDTPMEGARVSTDEPVKKSLWQYFGFQKYNHAQCEDCN